MKIRVIAAAVLIVVGILMCIGSVGSLELCEIGYFEAIVRSVIGFIFLAMAGTSAWVLFGKDFWMKLKKELN